MKQDSFFSNLYYSGCSPDLIINKIDSGVITKKNIKDAPITDFIKYLSYMNENISVKEEKKINELMDLYIIDNKKISKKHKFGKNYISFFNYLLINVPLNINNIKYLIINHNFNITENIGLVCSKMIENDKFSKEHLLKLFLFLNKSNINLSTEEFKFKENMVKFYLNLILSEEDNQNLKSFISLDLKNLNYFEENSLFSNITTTPSHLLKNKYNFIKEEIKYMIDSDLTFFQDNSREFNILCINDKKILTDISLMVNEKKITEENAIINYCEKYLFYFLSSNDFTENFIKILDNFSDNFYLKLKESLDFYINYPKNIEEINSKNEKFLLLSNYLNLKEEKIKITEILVKKENQDKIHKKRI